MSYLKQSIILVSLILIIDQILKIYIKTHFELGEEHNMLGNWFIIHFTENDGMAFGWKLHFLGKYQKLFLSLFRIVAIGAIGWYIVDLAKKGATRGLIMSMSLIFAGALGNILDSAFYGLLFSESQYHNIAQFMPEGGGYASFLYGNVVDMFYFPIIKGHFPDWLPFWTSEQFIFFRPVFNIADASITTGVFIVLVFQHKYFKAINETPQTATT